MITIPPLWPRRHRRLERGVAAIEAALLMPVAIFLVLGCVETYQYFRAEALINRVAFTVANGVAMQQTLYDRSQCTKSDDICIYNTITNDLFEPLDYAAHGGLIISAFVTTDIVIDEAGNSTVSWQNAPKWFKSYKGSPTANDPASRLTDTDIFPPPKAGDTLIVAEVFYAHEPYIMSSKFWAALGGTRQMYSRFVFRPRFDDLRELK
ncbi:pilus assembly protein [Alcaligenaceae bacterium CGII-47]|nr:pilus assembly protein [Alcaligenaceae bacterium CGII-47]